MRAAASLTAAAILALASAEIGARLYFPEHEADRVYWGPGAFVVEEGYPYRFRPNARAVAGREASFAHAVETNSQGFRDRREPPVAPRARRAILAGASFAFGLGVGAYDDLFHVQLERRLRDRPDWPDDLEIYNVSQSGYNLSTIMRLVREYRDRYQPEVVFLIVSPRAFRPQTAVGSEIVHGLRMAPDRVLPGGMLDWLRAHSYLVMRMVDPFEGGSGFHRDRVFGEPDVETDEAGIRARFSELGEFALELRREGVALFLIPVGGAAGVGPVLQASGYRVLTLPPAPEWELPNDMHWNALGHRESAAIVARKLPPYRALRRTAR